MYFISVNVVVQRCLQDYECSGSDKCCYDTCQKQYYCRGAVLNSAGMDRVGEDSLVLDFDVHCIRHNIDTVNLIKSFLSAYAYRLCVLLSLSIV